uniref:RNA helicase n=1 Tax=Panagrolaimus superbus TaxID=310955 RepID=A0A914Y1Y6_9BILA
MNYSSVITVPDEETMNAISSKTFEQLLIHSDIIQRIKNSGFDSPTAVQSSSIALGVLGKDLLVQAKHGAGKTLVYSILAANVLSDCHLNQQREPLVVILASTREACTHIKDILVKLIPDERSVCIFYGEDDFINNKNLIATGCTVAIGTPARMALLVKKGGISLKQSKLFVIDEADVLMPNSKDIKTVFNGLSEDIQVTAFTTTFSSELEKYLCEFMKSPAVVRIIPEGVQTLANQNPGNVAHGNSSDGKEVQVPSPINKSNVSDNDLTKVDRVEPQSQATDDVSIAVKNSDYYSSNNAGMGSWCGSPFGSSRGNGGLPSRGSLGSSRGNGFNSVTSSGYGALISAETSDAFTSNRGGFGQSSTQENYKWSKAPTIVATELINHQILLLLSPLEANVWLSDCHLNQQREPLVVILASTHEACSQIKDVLVKLMPDERSVCNFGTTGLDGFSSNRGNGYNQTSGRGGFGNPIVGEDRR